MPAFEQYKSPEFSDEDKFRQYMEELDLAPSDFDKKILDVGSGASQFAKWAKEHHVSNQIYSLEPLEDSLEKSKSTKGRAEDIPFQDESFDLVISSGAIPQIFSGVEYKKKMEEKIRQSLSEIVRVTRKGGEIRFGPIREGKYWQRQFRETLDGVLQELKDQNQLIIEEKFQGERGIKFDKKGNILEKEKVFLFKIYKPL